MTVFSPSMTCCFSWWDSIPLKTQSHTLTYESLNNYHLSYYYVSKPVESQEGNLRMKVIQIRITHGRPECLFHDRAPTFNETLTLDRGAFEWLSNLVPGFCHLSVLRNREKCIIFTCCCALTEIRKRWRQIFILFYARLICLIWWRVKE